MTSLPSLPSQRPGFLLPSRTGRLARSRELTAELIGRLTTRDRWLLRMLLEHQVLTTTQITQLAFGTTRAATARLLDLYQLRAIDRFRPLMPGPGTAPLHFVLDSAGAAMLAAEEGTTTADIGYRRDRALSIALSPALGHTIGANGFFTALAATARHTPGTALERWWSERRCAALWGDLTRPDGYGRWLEPAPGGTVASTDFFLEYDTGTENLDRLLGKLPGYAALAARTGITTPVLFALPSPRREAALRAKLAGPPPHGTTTTTTAATAASIPGVPIATTAPGLAPDADGSPAGPIWLPAASTTGPRLRLTQLAPAAAATTGTPAAEPATGLAWHPPSPAPPSWPGRITAGQP
jgi:hypothetical protein